MKFSDFIAQTPQQEAPKGEAMDLSLGCQTCSVQVDGAEFFREHKILQWRCPDGHLSYIEEWSLFG